ncbi:hypothetical protein L1987_52437 [Smallanthus sonchifolius]|uniref:Uncharacterized protein n=1 Tax=Smallanthus sonchifolius TaxID=185202 RepID=A0ACB9EST8_9ASTR|nr:hypothetical protein L1987_52437 [Smallanthus sonchifolius]
MSETEGSPTGGLRPLRPSLRRVPSATVTRNAFTSSSSPPRPAATRLGFRFGVSGDRETSGDGLDELVVATVLVLPDISEDEGGGSHGDDLRREVLCARPVIVAELGDEQASLAEWGKTCYGKGILLDIVDPKLSGEIAPECLRKFGDVASKCLHEEGSERPAMEEVVWRLEFALQLQEDAETMSKNIEP